MTALMNDANNAVDNAGFQNTDDADALLVLAAVRHCANSWVGSVRLLGNVRACDISRACTEALAALSTPNAPEAIARLAKSALSFAASAREGATKIGALDSRAASDTYKEFATQFERWAEEAAAILAVRLDEAAIRKDEREKAIHEADQFVGALWSDLFNKDMVKAAGAYFFDKWRAQIRAIAIRNGGKQP